MPEPQSLNAALFAAVAALTGALVHLYRENQKLHQDAKAAQEQMLRVMVVVEKALESFSRATEHMAEKLTGDSEEMRDAIVLLKERQATILSRLSPTSDDKSKRSLPR
jgi:hypothetical protein